MPLWSWHKWQAIATMVTFKTAVKTVAKSTASMVLTFKSEHLMQRMLIDISVINSRLFCP